MFNHLEQNQPNFQLNGQLIEAVQINHTDEVRRLLDEPGIDVNHADLMSTPLTIAIIRGHHEMVDILLAHEGIDVNLPILCYTPLMLAVQYARVNMVEKLLSHRNINILMEDDLGGTAESWITQYLSKKPDQMAAIEGLFENYKTCPCLK